jgi:hypothetical protein
LNRSTCPGRIASATSGATVGKSALIAKGGRVQDFVAWAHFLNIARLKILKVVQRHTVLLNLNGIGNSLADCLLEPLK